MDDATTVASFHPHAHHEIFIPSSTISVWFDPENYENTIHAIEEESLPEFFSGKYPSKTATVYKEYRNFMIALYRMNPTTYLSATTCRRHLSGDVNAIMRVHAFLEKWGLINFSCQPRYKPHKMSLLKEASYDRVLINSANKNLLQKSELEYANNLYIQDSKTGQQWPAIPEEELMRKINLATLKYRPVCSFGESKVGFRWFVAEEPSHIVLSEEAFLKGLYPKDVPRDKFSEHSLDPDIWALLEKDFNEENQLQAMTKESQLTTGQVTQLLHLVAENGMDDWKKIADELNLKNRREAILEFMRVKLSDMDMSIFAFQGASPEKDLKEVPIYNQADMYKHHCSMLISFADRKDSLDEDPKPKDATKKRIQKQKRKLALSLMQEKLG